MENFLREVKKIFLQIKLNKQLQYNGKEKVELYLRFTLCLHDAVLKDNAAFTFTLLLLIHIQCLFRIPF